MIEVPGTFKDYLLKKPETRHGYQHCTVIANDTVYNNVVISEETMIVSVDGKPEIPFTSAEIQSIIVTHGE